MNELGIAQAKVLAGRMIPGEWDVIVSSDLSRAKETALILADRLKLPLHTTDERLRERAWGVLEGTTKEERIRIWGKDWKELHPDAGEKDERINERGMEAIKQFVEAHKDKRILVVAHAAINRILMNGMLGRQDLKPLNNTSLSIVKYTGEGWNLELYNCTKHLDGLEVD